MSDDDIEDFDLDPETLNKIAATEAHFLASQKPKSFDSPIDVPSPDDPPPRKLTRRTGPSISNTLARSAQRLDIPKPSKPASAFRNPLATDNQHNGEDGSLDLDNKSFGASAQARSTPAFNVEPVRATSAVSAAAPSSRGSSGSGLAVEIARLRRQHDEEMEKRMQTSNQLNAQYEINFRAQGEIETVRRQALKDQEELKTQREKLRMENMRLIALNSELNKKSEANNEKMEVNMMFKQHEAETSELSRSRISTASPEKTQRRQPRPPLEGFSDFHDSFAVASPSSHTRSKTTAPHAIHKPATARANAKANGNIGKTRINRDGDDMDWESEQPFLQKSKEISAEKAGVSNVWTEITQLIFSHICCYPSISTKAYRQLTLQLILNAPFDENAVARDVERYNKASIKLLETFGETVMEFDQGDAINKVVKSLNVFVQVFLNCQMLSHLAETLALLASLVYAHENILGCLLDPSSGREGVSLVSSIIDLILAHLKPGKSIKGVEESNEPELIVEEVIKDNLTDCVLNLLEIIVLQSQDIYPNKLTPLLINSEALQIPLLPSQKWWCVHRWTRFLLFASAHRLLTVGILNQPRSNQVPSAENGYNATLLSMLSGYLTTRHGGMTALDTHHHQLLILSLLHTVSVDDDTVLTTLADSKVLIPSLINLLAKDSGMLWNEDSVMLYPSEMEYSTEMVVDRIIPTLHLLHKLIITTNEAKLAQKLQNNRASFQHMCIVSLGRIAFAQCPDFLSETYKEDMEYLSEVGRDLLTLIISPDEGDMVYLTYNSDDD
ncbi:hypothetical protein E3P94_01538 [Wallemia ichthyophaga]|nr:hypothetical protein E3P91_01672 [Wallemia ichthyophaga]TIA83955.1 hypothetical protein E3P98_00508 [Wallemia ichthyophaga]TIB01136.1 hypothetical protein E3P95_01406 [Wallemia ichthyophaga]TIB02147.1 hypothetical protein E3P94_01538 [Wallemia ichthyophaga]TIB66290.1 hypothetical protein E3P78_00127 [Wallemia ichthyophaga]